MVGEGCRVAGVGWDVVWEGCRMSGVVLGVVENEWVVAERSGNRLMSS